MAKLEIDIMDVKNINFPVYPLPNLDIMWEDGKVFIFGNRLVDDYNLPGDTIGKRRLLIEDKKYNIKTAYEDYGDMLEGRDKYFVDNLGIYFNYKRTKRCKVVPHKIKEVILCDGYSRLKLASIPFDVVIKRPPPDGFTWVGMLYVKKVPWIPYYYSIKKGEVKIRMV